MAVAHACLVDVPRNRTRRAAALAEGCRVALIAGGLLLGTTAGAQSTSDYAYWLDEFSVANVQNAPVGTMVIGETSSQQRQTITTTTNRIVGTTVTFQPGGSKKINWSFSPGNDLKSLFNTATPPSLATPCERRAFAQEIFNRTVSADSLDAFPTVAEATPTSTGGYVVWSQDLEGPMNVPEETASAIIAMMWAARELFTLTDPSTGPCTPVSGHRMQVVPTPASILQKSPASTAFPDGWNLSEVVTGGSSDNYVSFLKLDQTLSTDDQTALGQNKIDLLSFLHLATAEGVPLIDGILAQQYSSQGCTTDPDTGCLINCTHLNCQALPGRLSDDTPPFYDTTLPYAIQSAVSCPAQLYLDPPTDCTV